MQACDKTGHIDSDAVILTMLVEICLLVEHTMKRYLSTATNKIDNEEKKTQDDWRLPISLHTTSQQIFVMFRGIGLLMTDHAGSQGPVLASEVQEGERHSEEAQKEIRDGKIHYEDVSCCQQNLQDICLSKIYNDGNDCLCPFSFLLQ